MTQHFRFSKLFRYGLPAALALAGSVAIVPSPIQGQLPVIQFVRDPDPAPDFRLKDLDGKEVSLEASKGKVILLNFWASWCGPCRAEIPGLIELQEKYKERLQIIGVVVDDDDQGAVRDVVKTESINYPVAMSSLEVRMAYGGITALPTVFVINAEGKVVQKHVGLFNPALYETEVRALLSLPVAARVETFTDTGEIFLKHADRATMLPGVNTDGLTTEQRAAAMHKFNAEACTCGCQFTLAQCRIYDPACKISRERTAAIVKEVSGGKVHSEPGVPAEPAAPKAPAVAQPPPTAASPVTK